MVSDNWFVYILRHQGRCPLVCAVVYCRKDAFLRCFFCICN